MHCGDGSESVKVNVAVTIAVVLHEIPLGDSWIADMPNVFSRGMTMPLCALRGVAPSFQLRLPWQVP